jgi:hypothetical protein
LPGHTCRGQQAGDEDGEAEAVHTKTAHQEDNCRVRASADAPTQSSAVC